MSKLNDEVKNEIRAAVAKSWECIPFKLADELIDSILIGHYKETQTKQRLAMLYMMDGEKTLDAHGPYVQLPMNVFKVGVLTATNLGLPLCVVLATSEGPYWTVIAKKGDVLDGDLIALDSEELHVQIGVDGFRPLEM